MKNQQIPNTQKLKNRELLKLRKSARKVLKKLVTDQGIYASTGRGWKGPYHSWFGRDTAITADLVFAAEQLYLRKKLTEGAYSGLRHLATWQGSKNQPETGEEAGKLPHEIRKSFGVIDKLQHARSSNIKPWFVDPADGFLKNWDSCDSTPLWIMSMVRAHRAVGKPYDSATIENLRQALNWCLRNLDQYGGFAGFISANLQPGRVYSGLNNQGWKDSSQIYQYSDGNLGKHPIRDVLISAEMWAAFRYGADVFDKRNPQLAQRLLHKAELLKKHFNDDKQGFLFIDKSTELPFFAQALDSDNRKLEVISADVGICLWAFYGKECIIHENLIDQVVQRLMQLDIFNPKVGFRNYSLLTNFKGGTQYHGSPHTYWPYVSALIVRGLDNFGYKAEAQLVATAMLGGIKHFHSCIELFVETPEHSLEPWHHPKIEQQSATNQAWTAAGVYYAAQYLLKSS